MSLRELGGIIEAYQRVERVLTWFIQKVLRGTWYSRSVFFLVVFATFANPTIASSALSAVGAHLPMWYSTAYWTLIGLLVLMAIAIGAKSIPRQRRNTPSNIDIRAVRGLLPFNQEDSILFSQLERGIMLGRVLASLQDPNFRFGILMGISGSGKTSFLRAGMLAHLRDAKLPAAYVELSNEDPVKSIKRQISQQGYDVPTGVLLLDQFEQFFLHQRTAEQRKPLIDALKKWYRRNSGVRVLISIRAEDAWQMYEILDSLDIRLSNQNRFVLLKFNPEEAAAVVGVICENAGIDFNPGFVRRIVHQGLCDQDGLVSPVDLGIIIWVLATERRAFTPESYTAYGGIDGVLDAWLVSQLESARLGNLEKPAIRSLAVLCDFDTNRRAGILTVDAIAERLASDLSRDQVKRAVDWLASPDVRLIVRAEEFESAGYQLSHERLIYAIRKHVGRLLDDAARANELLDRRVREWVGNNRSSRFLLPLFEYWQIAHQSRYLIWGEARADKEALLKQSRKRWQQYAAAVPTLGLVAAIATLTLLHFWAQREQAPEALRAVGAKVSADGVSVDLPARIDNLREVLPHLNRLKTLRTLYIYGSVTSLDPISDLTGLTALRFADATQIGKLDALKSLKNLRSLDLTGARHIGDLDPLKELTDLVELRIGDADAVKDLNPLASLTKLVTLEIRDASNLADLSPLKHLLKLRSLSLPGAKGVQNLDPIRQLNHLHSLNLFGAAGIRDLKPIQDLQEIVRLDLGGTQDIDLEPLEKLTKLRSLDLTAARIRDAHVLGSLINLQYLGLRNVDNIGDLGQLKRLEKLEVLDLHGVIGITDLRPLEALQKLRSLDLGCSTASVAPLKDLARTSLQHLELRCPTVKDLDELEGTPLWNQLTQRSEQPFPDLSGAWICEVHCPAGGIGKSAWIVQAGNRLLISNEGGDTSEGRLEDDMYTLVATQWEGGLTAGIEDGGTLLRWGNSTIWKKQGLIK